MTRELAPNHPSELLPYLKLMALQGASDLFLSVGVAPTPVSYTHLRAHETTE